MADKKVINVLNLGEDMCVCCGVAVPEGRMVCQNCENRFFAVNVDKK